MEKFGIRRRYAMALSSGSTRVREVSRPLVFQYSPFNGEHPSPLDPSGTADEIAMLQNQLVDPELSTGLVRIQLEPPILGTLTASC